MSQNSPLHCVGAFTFMETRPDSPEKKLRQSSRVFSICVGALAFTTALFTFSDCYGNRLNIDAPNIPDAQQYPTDNLLPQQPTPASANPPEEPLLNKESANPPEPRRNPEVRNRKPPAKPMTDEECFQRMGENFCRRARVAPRT